MAGIQEYLDKIKNAVYGREVRQAIHDGIHQCYEDGKAGAVDLVAREQIAELVAPSGEAPSAAEVTDARIGADGTTYASLGLANRTQFSDIKNDFNESLIGNGSFHFGWEQGNLTLSTGAEEEVTWSIRTGFISSANGIVITPFHGNGYRTDVLKYNSDETYTGVYRANITSDFVIDGIDLNYKWRLRVMRTDLTPVDINVGTNVTYNYIGFENFLGISNVADENERAITGLITGKYPFSWSFGNIGLSDGVIEYANWSIYTKLTKFKQPVVITPYVASGWRTYLLKYNTDGTFTGEYVALTSTYAISESGTAYLYRLKLMRESFAVISLDDGDKVYYTTQKSDTDQKPLDGKIIVCFGDSIVGNFQPPNDYPTVLASITGATVYNAGFGGCCMADNGQARSAYTMCRLADSIASGNWSVQENSGVVIDYARVNSDGTSYEATGINYVPDKLSMLKSIDWETVDYITIGYGTNDWSSDFLLDNQSNAHDTTTYLGAFRYSVEKILTAYPNIKIVPITPIWRWWDTNTGAGAYGDSDTVENSVSHVKLIDMADGLIEASQIPYHLHVCDLYYNCGFNKQNRYEYFFTNDGTHPKPYGIEQLGIKVANELAYSLAK